MAVLTEESAAEKSNFKNSRGNGYGLRLRQRHFSGSVLTATTTTRKTDQDTATTATEKTTLNQVHSGPKTGSTSQIRSCIRVKIGCNAAFNAERNFSTASLDCQ